MIDPDTRRVEVFRPGDDGLWNRLDMSELAEVELASVGCRFAMNDLFKGMENERGGKK